MIKAIKNDDNIIIDYGNHLIKWNCEVPEVPLTFGEHKIKYIDGKAVLFEDIEELKNLIKKDFRLKCREEREKYFPDDVKDNLLVGCLYENELLTISNYKKLVDMYRDIVKNAEVLFDSAINKTDIDTIFNSIKFPSEADILEKVKE